jgi:DNA primase
MSYKTLQEALTMGKGTERMFCCPVHNDSHASASVNVNKGVWYCYTCHAKGKVEGFVDVDPRNLLEELLSLEEEIRIYPEGWLDIYDSPDDRYWSERFSKEAIVQFRLGRDRGVDVPTYPLRDPNGRVLGVVARNTEIGAPKYKYPRGVKTSNLLFNMNINSAGMYLVPTESPLNGPILVEGAMDVVAVWEAGFDALACFSARLYEKQIGLLQKAGVDVVYLAYDLDKAGKLARIEATEKLESVGIKAVQIDWDEKYKDIAEIPLDERKTLLVSYVH